MGFDREDYDDFSLTPLDPALPALASAILSAIVAAIIVGAVIALYAVVNP